MTPFWSGSWKLGVHRPIEFAISTDITRGPGASLFRLTRFISDELDRSSSLARERLVIAKLEDTALTALLTGLTHNYSARFRQRIAETTPRQVRVVEEYIEANADEPISIGELADLAGVSAKSLFAAFRRHRGYSPMAYVKSCRLLRAREELTTAAPGANVTLRNPAPAQIADHLSPIPGHVIRTTWRAIRERLAGSTKRTIRVAIA
jgi:AraC-like DNA-binding protein